MTGRTPWASFTLTLLAAAAALCVVFLCTAFLVDPYDTGHSPLKLNPGVRPQGPRTAAPSRARDPQFTGAVFGNSHVQLLSPENLSKGTGIPFVSLAAPATLPRETLTTIDWFLSHHRQVPPKAIIVGVDHYWCTSDPALPNEKPFPFWLLSRNLLVYIGGLMSYDVFEEIPRRIAYVLSRDPERARPDGYWSYEDGYELQGYHQRPELRAKLEIPMDLSGGNLDGPFPAAARLEELMKSAPAETALVMVRPPVYASALSKSASAIDADAACRKAFADIATRRPNTLLMDWKLDRPVVHDANLFFDQSHYRSPIARLIEADIVDALGKLGK